MVEVNKQRIQSVVVEVNKQRIQSVHINKHLIQSAVEVNNQRIKSTVEVNKQSVRSVHLQSMQVKKSISHKYRTISHLSIYMLIFHKTQICISNFTSNYIE